MPKAIGTLGTIETLTVGGRIFTDLSNLIILRTLTATGGIYGTLRKGAATSGYQVTAGKTYTVNAAKCIASPSATTLYGSYLIYGDNDIGQNAASPPTNSVYYGASSPFAPVAVAAGYTGTLFSENGGLDFPIPATKYPGAFSDTGTTFNHWVYGYET